MQLCTTIRSDSVHIHCFLENLYQHIHTVILAHYNNNNNNQLYLTRDSTSTE